MANQKILIVGGGVIGLSIAWELNRRGFETIVVDVNQFGKKASWAGAGILAPANFETMTQPLDRLRGYGSQLHLNWANELKTLTGIDNGYRECGGLYLARTPGEEAALIGQLSEWEHYGIEFEQIAPESLKIMLGHDAASVVHVPSEHQICNPLHLDALVCACAKSGSQMIAGCGPIQFKYNRDVCSSATLESSDIALSFDQVCIAVGAWSSILVEQFGVALPVVPVRGQMLLYKSEHKLFDPILNEGSRYIVPRDDGHIVVGSTTEEVGFDESTTESAITDLRKFAEGWVPELNSQKLVSTWSGLRPASHDGFPFMGRLAEFENVWVATGHFKAGLQMSPAVAEIMADLIQNQSTKMETEPFDPSRLNVDSPIGYFG